MHCLCLSLILLGALLPAAAQDVSVLNTDCVNARDTFETGFEIPGDRNRNSWYWVGLYRNSDVERFSRRGARLEGEPELWVWACGNQDCEDNPRRGRVVLGRNRPGDWGGRSWPPPPARYRMALINFKEDEDEPDTYTAVAYSNAFEISNDCAGGNGNNDNNGNDEQNDEQSGQEDDNDEDNDSPTPSSGMAAVVRNARTDIAALIQARGTLSALYLRMIFHDCVGGGCDGCINTSNQDNGGLTTAMNSLRDVEGKYRSQGLSRADLWVLASYVAIDMTMPGGDAVNNPFIPFRHYGRQNCDSTNPRRGPDPELCSPDFGTDEIVEFFAEHFDFSARETAAIMGAHTIGVLRRNILGFAGENGWVPDNTRFDNQYYEELVGGGGSTERQMEGAPQWRQAIVDNSDLAGLPDRFQWEGFPNGRKVVMLNSDVAMVRQLDNSNKDPRTGQVSCKFVNREPGNRPRCPAARRDLFDPMVEYRQNNGRFLQDFRGAIMKMTITGYRVSASICDTEGMCELQRN